MNNNCNLNNKEIVFKDFTKMPKIKIQKWMKFKNILIIKIIAIMQVSKIHQILINKVF